MPRGSARHSVSTNQVQLILQTDALQECRARLWHRRLWCPGFLGSRFLGSRFPGSGIAYRPQDLDPCGLLRADLWSVNWLDLDLCPQILHRSDSLMLLHRWNLGSGILDAICLGILLRFLHGLLRVLHGPDVRLCIPALSLRIPAGRPGLELTQQGAGRRLRDCGLTLIGCLKRGSASVAGRRLARSRLGRRSGVA
jgi:hypothetical protein